MIYRYRAVSQTGEIIEGAYEASDEKNVLEMLKSNKYLPIKIEKDVSANSQITIFSSKVKKKDLAVFCRQFYTMLNAGIGIIKCVDILEQQTENKTLVSTLSNVHEDIQKGQTLSQSMSKHENVFPHILINMVEAGEISGNLDAVIERMSLHFEKESKMDNKIKAAMMYPLILSIVSISVVIFLLIAVMPTFIGMFESSGQALPLPTQILLNISNSLTQYWYLFLVLIITFMTLIMYYKKTIKGKRFFDGLKLKIPLIKSNSKKIITSRFTRTLSTLIASGIPLLATIQIVGKVVGNSVIEEKMDKALDDVRRGVTLSKAISDIEVFPVMVKSMIKIGEESGNLDEILNKTADFYDDEVEASLQKMTALIEPIMMVVMAIIIGFIVIAIAMPMFDMVNTI